MKKVLRLDKEEKKEKPVEFLQYWDGKEWREVHDTDNPLIWGNVMYRETIAELDYFICWDDGNLEVIQYRGHLNSGKY